MVGSDRSTINVCVIDDDDVVRESLKLLIETQGVRVLSYASCPEFLDDPQAAACACLVLDVRLPGMSGIRLQERLLERGDVPPIIFVSGHADVPTAVQAMRAGALDFLQKPFPEQVLLDRVEQAIELFRRRQTERVRRSTLAARQAQLTSREREVLECLLAGKANKQIADALDISVKTVEQHRARVMEKMRASSLAELVQSIQWLRQQ